MSTPISQREFKYWSIQHIQGAAALTAMAADIDRNADAVKVEIGRREYTGIVRYRSFVTGAVFSSVAFLEAVVNELIAEIGEQGTAVTASQLSDKEPAGLLEARSFADRLPTLTKYQLVLALLSRPRFDISAQPYQDAAVLMSLRNELIHYAPEWLDISERPQTIVLKLANKFPLSSLEPEFVGQRLDRYISYGCARWAVESSLSFADEFFRRLGITGFYQRGVPQARDLLP